MKQIQKNGAIVLMAFVLVVGIVGVSVSAREGGFGMTGNAIGNGHVPGNVEFNANSNMKNFGQIEKEYQNSNESNSSLEDSLNQVNRFAGIHAAASGFAQVSHGTGWAINSNNDTGTFAQITLVQRPFVNVTNGTNSTNSTEFTVGNGVLKLTGEPAFNLQLENSSGNTFVFNVTGDNTGTLTMTKETSLTGFTVWTGNLDLNNGNSWSLHVATMDSKMEGEMNAVGTANNGQASHIQTKLENAKSEGFWARLRAFFGFGPGPQYQNTTNSTNSTNSS